LDLARRIDGAPKTDGDVERTRRKLIKVQRFADCLAHAAERERPATRIR